MENLPLNKKPIRLTRSQSRLASQGVTHEEDKRLIVLAEKLINVSIEDCNTVNKSDVKPNIMLPDTSKRSFKTLIGREKEVIELKNFLKQHFDNFTKANLYISGSPGTGKTLVVSEVLEELASKGLCKYHFINCMDFSNPPAVYREILFKLTGKQMTNTSKAADEVERYLKQRQSDKKPIVIVLDEVDQLLLRNKIVLYKILGWVEVSTSRLVTIGIANSLDLTERMLPDLLLQSYRPHHVNFPPYSEAEISSIIMSRVETDLNPVEMQAVKFCSKKVSAKSGDARAAIDLYKRALELSELEELASMRCAASVDHLVEPTELAGPIELPVTPQKKVMGTPLNTVMGTPLNTVMGTPLNTVMGTPLKHVMSTPQLLARKMSMRPAPNSPSIKHVNRAIKEVERGADAFRNIVNTESGKSTLPLHQKLGLCAGLILSRLKLKKPILLGQLHDKYDEVCRSQDIEPIDMSNFIDCVVHLESRGLARIKPHKESRQRIFTMNLDEAGIEKALGDEGLLSSIMNRFM